MIEIVKEIIYKDFRITLNYQGYYEIHTDNGFMKFDTLEAAKREIRYWSK